jgi:hypothetical protein
VLIDAVFLLDRFAEAVGLAMLSSVTMVSLVSADGLSLPATPR